ncbi:methenyltetrahydromethanopterin cyclohydrolase [Methermicoccus shengliensis]|uniref:Methenyltetrahydromethanopterin cyclohydrolase n=1 Tax=Methermicoccus shengliensis TaxID=660064 RepID=A0A832RXM8_9EURY|nr:methenyltetrahydromethanopterin cyclohydrolase [Methermicoccus shengliensis]KUK05183.1 MAG: Methenyltetrahydromethanopterin cyclohydrolase [Euryarchaeota archaeon 55_53]MDI3487343.1 methenyltetrahydromethanopterin cyclohydrolase [Methanosarcinales archaeon]MDN5294583.1 methenyltetrahydromethanopterin cyclohydrolase [Methanosarcinales archaeon]HIH69291.1 methenyltetrahydromethanopterin cyclohydrolase [Methermicoccus shengliensis]
MLSVNEGAMAVIEEMLDYTEELKVKAHELSNGGLVIDCGVEVEGSYAAGLMFSDACMGGLATTSLRTGEIAGVPLQFIDVVCDHPAIACLGAQKAGWQISVGDYFAMGSGPARALALKPKKTYERIEYEDDSDGAVIALESRKLPDEKVIEYIAESCDVDPSGVVALVAPTASIVGSVQVSARVVETAVFKLNELGYDTRKIAVGAGCAPIAPVVKNDMMAMGATNDSVIYYGAVQLSVSEFDEELFKKVPSETSRDYGKPFYQTFEDAGHDFYKIDPYIFAPASITVNELSTGKTYQMGRLNAEVILESYGIQRL